MQPGPQKRGGLHVFGEHPARAANKSFNAQRLRPGLQLGRTKGGQQRLDLRLAFAITRHEGPGGLGVREIQAAFTCQQKLAAHRRHGVIHLYQNGRTRTGQNFSGHQARRATAYDSDAQRSGSG